MADTNPWGAASWNPVGQAAYEVKNGRARAEARARDAGTYYGGPSPAILTSQKNAADAMRKLHEPIPVAAPVQRTPFASAAIVRPGSVAIYALTDQPAESVPDRTNK